MDIVLEKLQTVPDLAVKFAPSLILAVIIFIVGRFIVRKASVTTITATQRIPNIDLTLAKFFGSLVLFIGMGVVVIMALSALKLNLAFIASIIAALMVALGFALQESLGDFASGIMLALFRPFAVGQEVEVAEQKGVVHEMGLFSTRLLTRQNVLISIGNGAVFGGTIKNYFEGGRLRLHMDVGVSYDADLDEAIAVLKDATKKEPRIHAEPAPWVKVTELGDSAVNLQMRVWTDAEDHRKVKMELPKLIKEALDAANIEIPYEQGMLIVKNGKEAS